jgi:RNA polymerase sigma-70 factor (ECF subfamily)
MPDDKALINRAVKLNDRRAFGELVKRYQSQLRYSLRQLTGWDDALAEDLAQETFIKAYRNLSKFRGDAAFFTWLYRIAYREFAEYCRSKKPEDPSEQLPETSAPEGTTDLHRDMAQALMQFKPEQRSVLHLHLHHEYTQQEIADLMDMPLGSVKSLILRGKDQLKSMLSDWHLEAREHV